MDDFFKIIFIIGGVVIYLYKQYNKFLGKTKKEKPLIVKEIEDIGKDIKELLFEPVESYAKEEEHATTTTEKESIDTEINKKTEIEIKQTTKKHTEDKNKTGGQTESLIDFSHFDATKAIIYSEIMTPKHKEY